MSRRREEREFARALVLSTQLPHIPFSSDQPPASILLSSPSKDGSATDNQQSNNMSGKRSTEDVVADSEDDEIIGETSLGSEEQVRLSLKEQSSPRKSIPSSASHVPTKDTIGTFTPLPISAAVPAGTTSTIQTYADTSSSGVDRPVNEDTSAPLKNPSVRPKPRPKIVKASPLLSTSITTTTTTGSHIPTTRQLDSTMPNTAGGLPVTAVPSTRMEEDVFRPVPVGLPPTSPAKTITYTRKNRRRLSVSSDSEQEPDRPGPSKSLPPKSSRLVVAVEVESAPRTRKRPIHFGFDDAETTTRKVRVRSSTSPRKAGRSPSPDPLDDDTARSNAGGVKVAPVKTDTCEVEPEKPISKRGKVIESEEEDYAPVEKSKSKSKEKSRPTAETAGRSRNGKGKAVETILWSDAESELAVVQDESERGEAATKKSKSRKSTKKSKMTPKGKPQKAVVASEFKSAEMIESDDEEGQEGIDRMAVKARPSHKSVTTKKLVPGKNAVSRVVETDEEEGEEEEEEDEEQESIVASKHASSITPINRNLEAKGLKASKKAVTVSPTHSPAHKTISTPPLRSIPVNASSPAVKPQQPSVIIDKNGNVKAFKTARDDLPQVVAKSGGVKTTGFSRRTHIPSLHRKIKTPPKKLPPVPQKAQKRKKGDDSDEDSDGLDENGKKKIRRGDKEWYMQADDGF